jgi:hypothetical protein
MWEVLLNVMPITSGGLNRRWGFSAFTTSPTAGGVQRLFTFQRDSDLLRTIVAAGSSIQAFRESNGTVYNSNIFSPQQTPRMVNSRSYGYFYSGNAADLKKWDGSASGGVSNWGIPASSSEGSSSFTVGPALPTSATGAAWTNPGNVTHTDGSLATVTLASGVSSSGALTCKGFGFAIPANATIQGISVTGTARGDTSNLVSRLGLDINLVRAGTPSGNPESIGLISNGGLETDTIGGSTDLWGTSWQPADINATNFGLSIQASRSNGSNNTASFGIDAVQITIAYTIPINTITVADGGSGSLNLTVGRIYYVVPRNSVTGHLGDLNNPSLSTGPLVSRQISLTTIPVNQDPQVDTKVILATADGGDPTSLYQVAIIANAQTTYTDNLPEEDLLLNQLYLFTDEFGNDFGVAGNTPPPNGNVAAKHKGRIWMAVGQNIYFSKSVSELTLPNGFIAGKYEESWPADTFLDISEGAETVRAMLSSGQALFIGTERHIRWITGDDPTNFAEPEIIHPEVGVLNQEVWQPVFMQGTPSGCIWLTPDFRCILSDFNSYQDIGHPIQDVLDSINPDAALLSHAMYVNDGSFDLYILSIATGNATVPTTHLVFNMRSQKWVVWFPSSDSTAMLFNVAADGTPQWLFSSSGTSIFRYTPDAGYTDNGATIPVVARSSWLHLGAPTTRKLLEEIEIIGNPAMGVTVEGKSPQQDFSFDPLQTLKSAIPVVSPFGQLKVYLATTAAKYRYYRLTFTLDSGTDTNFLLSYNLKSLPFNTL